MSDHAFILFDDGHDLAPLTDMRAGFELRTGMLTTIARFTRQLPAPIAALIVPSYFAALANERFALPINQLPHAASHLLLNGRATALLPDAMNLAHGNALLTGSGDLIAAHLDPIAAQGFLATRKLPASVHTQRTDFPLLTHPWQLLDHVRTNLPGDLAASSLPSLSVDSHAIHTLGDHRVRIAPSASLHPMLVLDTSLGDIVIDQHAIIEPFVVLQGPCYIGANTTIAAHAHIRPFTVIGEHCKIGGEINASIIHSHSNKAHLGYLGNSIVGQWVNLGAGTTTSNLKNTYGPVHMQTRPDTPAQNTCMNFLGSIIGDHVKTAIGTRLNTGSCLATGVMYAAGSFTPKYIDRFAFITDRAAGRYDFAKFCEVASRIMHRRNLALTPAEVQRLQQLHSTIRV